MSYLSNAEKKGVVGGAASNTYVNTECAGPITYQASTWLAGCTIPPKTNPPCSSMSVVMTSCSVA
ncbi:MAG: hypothetical protein ACN6PN_01750 [Sphingobacterium sp.]